MANDGDKSYTWLKELIQPDRLAYAVIGSAIVVFVLVFVGFLIVVTEPGNDYERASTLSRALAPFIAFLVAIVTFFTVLWRGAINQQQALEDERQNDLKDEVELGLLFEKATGYLAEGIHNKTVVGLAMLEAVILAKNEKYAVPALDVLLEHFVEFALHNRRFFNTSCRLIIHAVALGRRGTAGNRFDFKAKKTENNDDLISLPFGFPKSVIVNARLRIRSVNRVVWGDNPKHPRQIGGWRFINCTLAGDLSLEPVAVKYRLAQHYENCDFKRVPIARLDGYFQGCSFKDCNFSGAEISNNALRRLVRTDFQDCHYHPDRPPIFIENAALERDEKSKQREFLEKVTPHPQAHL